MANNSIKPEPSLQNVLDDIEMYQVLLKSIYDSVNPDETLKAEYEEKLAGLQQELETLQPLPTWDAMSSETSSQDGEADARSQSTTTTGVKDELSSTTSDQNPYGPYVKTESNLDLDDNNAYTENEQSTIPTFLADVASTSPYGRSDQTPALPTRKRPFSGEHDYSFSKSKRATPSPAMSAGTTPSSVSEFDDMLSNLLGSDFKQEFKDYEREQREWDTRQEQERRDAELARSIQESWNSPMSFSKPQSFSTIQTSLGSSSGSVCAMLPPPVPQIKTETSAPNRYTAVKSEQPPSMPGSFPTTGRTYQNDNSSSSSLEEISPSSFVPRFKPEPTSHLLPVQPLDTSQSMFIPQSSFIPQYGGSGVYNAPSNAYAPTSYSGYGSWPNFTTPADYQSNFGTASKGLSSIYDNAEEFLSNQSGSSSKLDDLLPVHSDPANTHEELKKLLANIRPDEEVHPANREGTPEAMKCTLMEHQKLGLTWMKGMEDASSKGGILADDMGLGKTVQALSLIVSRKSENPACKTTLIVAPVALMGQWAREISKLIKRGRHSLTVETLHANTRDLQWSKLREKDVVLTTYGTLASEVKRKHIWEEKLKRVPNAKPTSRSEHIPLLGEKSRWYRVILDEAQWIKNKATKAALAACNVQAEYRWCLTGTPMQNSVDELYSLIRFLRIPPYSSLEKFNRDFSRPLKAKNSYGNTKENAMQQLQALLKAIMLRRTKDSKIDGQPILQLPEKTIEEQYATFSKDEHEFYQALESRAKITFNKYLKAGTVGRNYSNALVLLLRLRQACCHPHLIRDLELETGASPENIDKLANAETLPAEVVERIKKIEAFECPICFDAAINSLIFNPCGHPSCNECFDRLATQAHANADNEAGSNILCPSCRGKVDPAKLTDFKSFKKAFGNNAEGDDENKDPDPQSKTDDEETESDSDSDSDETDDDVDDDGDLAGFIVPDNEIDFDADHDEDKKNGKGKITLQPSSKEEGGGDAASRMQRKPKRRSKGKGKSRESSTKHLSLAQLRKEGLKNKAAKKRYLRRLEKNFQTSAKIEKAIELLDAIEARGTNEKTIVFSQFTSLLDLLEVPLSGKDLQYKRYDGSMKPNEREQAVMTFTDDPRCTVLLVSLKAGNSGLNLTVASQVIIFDPHWNWCAKLLTLCLLALTHGNIRYTEAQAIDRAYRIGQMRSVQVHRLLVPDTVEDRILALQEKKRELIETALDENAARNVSRLGVRELGYLFVSLVLLLSKPSRRNTDYFFLKGVNGL
jgi:SNF2 family DNA or RNA helicase